MDGNEWNMDAKINEQVKNKKQDNMITPEIRYAMHALACCAAMLLEP